MSRLGALRLAPLAAATAALALTAPAAGAPHDYPAPESCGSGEPAYTGWNYWNLKAYGLRCSTAHETAEEYVYDFSTEGVIEPPDHWDRCKDRKVGEETWKGKCTRTKQGEDQKITFRFGGPDQPWYS